MDAQQGPVTYFALLPTDVREIIADLWLLNSVVHRGEHLACRMQTLRNVDLRREHLRKTQEPDRFALRQCNIVRAEEVGHFRREERLLQNAKRVLYHIRFGEPLWMRSKGQ